MATQCARATDCLAGRAFFGAAHRGVRAAPAPVPAPRRPMQRKQQQHEGRVPGTAFPPVAASSGRANGRQRRRGSPPASGAGSPPPPHKRVMENVVILKRGEPIPPVVAPALPAACQRDAKAEAGTVAAGVERGKQTKEKDGAVTFAGQSGAPASSAEPAAAAADKHVPDTEAKNAEDAEHGAAGAPAKAEPMASPAHQAVLPRPRAAKEAEQAPVATAGAATKAKQALPAAYYAGPSFASAAPDPRSLPIPFLLLKTRRPRKGGSDDACACA